MAKNNQISYTSCRLADIKQAFAWICIGLIKLYRYCISPFLGCHCRFVPSCSCYAEQAVRVYGAWRGGCLALLRLAKCHPWHAGGEDPLPVRQNTTEIQHPSKSGLFNQLRN